MFMPCTGMFESSIRLAWWCFPASDTTQLTKDAPRALSQSQAAVTVNLKSKKLLLFYCTVELNIPMFKNKEFF